MNGAAILSRETRGSLSPANPPNGEGIPANAPRIKACRSHAKHVIKGAGQVRGIREVRGLRRFRKRSFGANGYHGPR